MDLAGSMPSERGASGKSTGEQSATVRPTFPWPEGKRAAVSLSFDDALEVYHKANSAKIH